MWICILIFDKGFRVSLFLVILFLLVLGKNLLKLIIDLWVLKLVICVSKNLFLFWFLYVLDLMVILLIIVFIFEFNVKLLLFLEFWVIRVDDFLKGLLVILWMFMIYFNNINLLIFFIMLMLVWLDWFVLVNKWGDWVLFVCLYWVMVFIKELILFILCKNIFLEGFFMEFFFLKFVKEFVVFWVDIKCLLWGFV